MIHLGKMWLPTTVFDLGATSVRLLGVHVTEPMRNVIDWRAELATLGGYARPRRDRSSIAGDFNATRWNPQYADLLQSGLNDTVETTGAVCRSRGQSGACFRIPSCGSTTRSETPDWPP